LIDEGEVMRNLQHWQGASVERLIDLSPTVREFTLRPDEGVSPWTVGSHLKIAVETGLRDDERCYSLIGLPQGSLDAGVYRIAVKRVEASRGGSRFMWSLSEGARVRIGEPNNHFELSLAPPQTLIVAGGIGITPLVGMAQTLAARGADFRFCYAARDDAELVYADVLGEVAQTFVSARGQRIDLDAEIARLAADGQLLVCGPIPLLDAARAAWQRAGRPADLLRFETFGSSGAHASESFWVRLPRHRLQIEVPADRSLLDVLEEHGVETLSDCRRGECGLCAVDIVSVEGEVDHRDVFFSAEEKRDNRRLCACVSRISGGGVVLDSAYRADAA
jgi:ferredoxin-NADP reductase